MGKQAGWFSWMLLLILTVIWGSSFILMKRGLESFTPLQIGALRIALAGIALAPFIAGKARNMSRQEWLWSACVGILGNAIPAFLFPLAETVLNSATTGALNALTPLFVIIVGSMFFHLKVSKTQIVGVIIGFSGALMLVLGGEEKVDLTSHIGFAGVAVLATFLYGISTNVMKRYLNHTPSAQASGFALLAGAIPYSIYLMFDQSFLTVFANDPHAWTAFGYIVLLSIVGTAFALILFYRLVQKTNPVFAASLTYLIPIVAVGWGMVDGEMISLQQILGVAIILVGVFIANRS
ncbi:DMT family transporter [Pontibacter sp. G13]|uniref:DMT family transporter n=1 Tax=Pontibacter sp. G13 TaxID=3074898 RepID=UPI00288AECFE|nr:DMT family transporter [Pontibacter sp. G13]WNJ21141.1 DMT family transporter [Pontibacter sp. G13]